MTGEADSTAAAEGAADAGSLAKKTKKVSKSSSSKKQASSSSSSSSKASKSSKHKSSSTKSKSSSTGPKRKEGGVRQDHQKKTEEREEASAPEPVLKASLPEVVVDAPTAVGEGGPTQEEKGNLVGSPLREDVEVAQEAEAEKGAPLNEERESHLEVDEAPVSYQEEVGPTKEEKEQDPAGGAPKEECQQQQQQQQQQQEAAGTSAPKRERPAFPRRPWSTTEGGAPSPMKRQRLGDPPSGRAPPTPLALTAANVPRTSTHGVCGGPWKSFPTCSWLHDCVGCTCRREPGGPLPEKWEAFSDFYRFVDIKDAEARKLNGALAVRAPPKTSAQKPTVASEKDGEDSGEQKEEEKREEEGEQQEEVLGAGDGGDADSSNKEPFVCPNRLMADRLLLLPCKSFLSGAFVPQLQRCRPFSPMGLQEQVDGAQRRRAGFGRRGPRQSTGAGAGSGQQQEQQHQEEDRVQARISGCLVDQGRMRLLSVVNLCLTERHYEPQALRRDGLSLFWLKSQGGGEVPTRESLLIYFKLLALLTMQGMRTAERWAAAAECCVCEAAAVAAGGGGPLSQETKGGAPGRSSNSNSSSNSIVGCRCAWRFGVVTHCTHGLNRTGFFVAALLMVLLNLTADEAQKVFEEARGRTIARQEIAEALRKLQEEGAPIALRDALRTPELDPTFARNAEAKNIELQKGCCLIRIAGATTDDEQDVASAAQAAASGGGGEGSTEIPIFDKFKKNLTAFREAERHRLLRIKRSIFNRQQQQQQQEQKQKQQQQQEEKKEQQEEKKEDGKEEEQKAEPTATKEEENEIVADKQEIAKTDDQKTDQDADAADQQQQQPGKDTAAAAEEPALELSEEEEQRLPVVPDMIPNDGVVLFGPLSNALLAPEEVLLHLLSMEADLRLCDYRVLVSDDFNANAPYPRPRQQRRPRRVGVAVRTQQQQEQKEGEVEVEEENQEDRQDEEEEEQQQKEQQQEEEQQEEEQEQHDEEEQQQQEKGEAHEKEEQQQQEEEEGGKKGENGDLNFYYVLYVQAADAASFEKLLTADISTLRRQPLQAFTSDYLPFLIKRGKELDKAALKWSLQRAPRVRPGARAPGGPSFIHPPALPPNPFGRPGMPGGPHRLGGPVTPPPPYLPFGPLHMPPRPPPPMGGPSSMRGPRPGLPPLGAPPPPYRGYGGPPLPGEAGRMGAPFGGPPKDGFIGKPFGGPPHGPPPRGFQDDGALPWGSKAGGRGPPFEPRGREGAGRPPRGPEQGATGPYTGFMNLAGPSNQQGRFPPGLKGQGTGGKAQGPSPRDFYDSYKQQPPQQQYGGGPWSSSGRAGWTPGAGGAPPMSSSPGGSGGISMGGAPGGPSSFQSLTKDGSRNDAWRPNNMWEGHASQGRPAGGVGQQGARPPMPPSGGGGGPTRAAGDGPKWQGYEGATPPEADRLGGPRRPKGKAEGGYGTTQWGGSPPSTGSGPSPGTNWGAVDFGGHRGTGGGAPPSSQGQWAGAAGGASGGPQQAGNNFNGTHPFGGPPSQQGPYNGQGAAGGGTQQQAFGGPAQGMMGPSALQQQPQGMGNFMQQQQQQQGGAGGQQPSGYGMNGNAFQQQGGAYASGYNAGQQQPYQQQPYQQQPQQQGYPNQQQQQSQEPVPAYVMQLLQQQAAQRGAAVDPQTLAHLYSQYYQSFLSSMSASFGQQQLTPEQLQQYLQQLQQQQQQQQPAH
ncbi:hypothetical protein ACSSS7_003665 [Eimeria intestinalis]